MPRPHAAAVLEDAYNGRKARVLQSRGWTTRVVPLTGDASDRRYFRIIRPDGEVRWVVLVTRGQSDRGQPGRRPR